ncbi:putative hydrolase or acyltransferase (alpha/beta hydrolase superfamily) [Rubidibacter lacunae KORDI 51-2]|uniref:Putative hydrolase or acyltransferase (Alpha/beta hydrolase superfamily) n=1 Tax=Rubidibacter lacunae KORDI 51-2 TaxID=582515 RepID=U5D6X8_9CHRO|nr:alpha/beta hydrolase [Rubidibacter lacunae]ERN40408.1 putative hydrolase or acyltransferase (alpha/beta hydrolase superfamily) [Rubidibacter lacunae KORDI 51-2]
MQKKQFPSFLPAEAAALSEPTSLAIAEQIERLDVPTPLYPQPIPTAYVRQGQRKPPLLLLHGFDSSLLEFRRLAPLLSTEREVWALDLLGFGFTERVPGLRLGPDAIAEHLRAFWQTAIAEPVVLVGASMGGSAAIAFALAHPEAVAQLVLIDSTGIASGPALGKFLPLPVAALAAEILRPPRVRAAICRAAFHDPNSVTADAELCGSLHVRMPGWRRALAEFTRSGGYASVLPNLGAIAPPTLIVWGRGDRILGTKDADRFARGISNSKLVWIERGGHVPHVEAAAEVAAAIRSFLGV